MNTEDKAAWLAGHLLGGRIDELGGFVLPHPKHKHKRTMWNGYLESGNGMLEIIEAMWKRGYTGGHVRYDDGKFDCWFRKGKHGDHGRGYTLPTAVIEAAYAALNVEGS